MSSDIKHIIDWTAVGGAVAAFFKFLPDLAALLSVIWLALRIYELVRNLRKDSK